MSLSHSERLAIQQNLFHCAHWLLDEAEDFPWHRDGQGKVTAALPQSSQALAIDLFATLERLSSRDQIVNAWCRHLDLPVDQKWRIEPEHLVDRELLGEQRRSQLDAVAWGSQQLIVWEAKFTEQDGGGCSQALPLKRGANKGKVQCSGRYTMQVNPVTNRQARCALSDKGIRYWEFVPEFLGLDAEADHDPCPFRGGAYQWMRNVVAAAAMGRVARKSAAFVLLHAGPGLPMAGHLGADGDFTRISRAASAAGLPVGSVTYQDLIGIAIQASTSADAETMTDLGKWIGRKVDVVHRGSAVD